MPFEIVRNDIVKMQVDAVVNTANPNPVIGSGVDSGIHKKAGWKLLAARRKIGRIDFGDAAITPGFGLDAVGGAIHHIGNVHKYARKEDVPEKTLFIITTDGMENASRRYSYDKVRRMIERQKKSVRLGISFPWGKY